MDSILLFLLILIFGSADAFAELFRGSGRN